MKTRQQPSSGKQMLSFTSEELLRQALAGLLTKMPGVYGIQLLHGAAECGKDLIFYTQGALEEEMACACVVKNARISGCVDDNLGARNVLTQVEQALDTPFLNGSGVEVVVCRA